MKYTHNGGVAQGLSRTSIIALAVGFALTLVVSVFSFVSAAATTFDFTSTELTTNWEADRYLPTDGVSSETVFGRTNVARLGVDSADTQPGTFQRTEGIKTVGVNNFGDSVEVDLYLDPAWEDTAVRAGLWVVGDDAGARDNWFGIIEFVNNEDCPEIDCSNQGNITDHEGFRIWDSTVGWSEDLTTSFDYGEWVTLKIELDTSTQTYKYYIDDVEVGTATAGDQFIREVFLNSYNYGLDSFPTLNSDSYAAHWHGGPATFPPQVEGLTIIQNSEDIGCDAYVDMRTITVDWNDSTAGDFDHYIYQADDGIGGIDFTTTVTTSERTGQIRDTDGTYQYRVRAVDTVGNMGDWSEWCMVTLDREAPTAPEIIFPVNEQYFISQPILNDWTDSTDDNGIDKYQIEYVYDDGHTFSGAPYRETVASQRNHTPGISEQGGVEIRVRAYDNAGHVSDWSNTVHYYYDATAPTVPTPLFPTDGAVLNSADLFVDWDESSDNVTDLTDLRYEYRLYLENPDENPGTSLRYGQDYVGSTRHPASGFAPGTPEDTYFWQVRACDLADLCSVWSEAWEFVVDNTEEEPVDEGFVEGVSITRDQGDEGNVQGASTDNTDGEVLDSHNTLSETGDPAILTTLISLMAITLALGATRFSRR